MVDAASRSSVNLANLIFVFALIQFVLAGLVLLHRATADRRSWSRACMSIALILQILFMYQQGDLYKWLPPIANRVIVAIYIAICAIAFYHFWYEFEEIAIYRQGSYTRAGLHRRPADVPAGDGTVAARASGAVLDQRRPGRSTRSRAISARSTSSGTRAPRSTASITSSTVELSTGIYGIYGQLALTLIAAFLLLAGGRQRLRRAARHDQRDAPDRRTLAADGAADRGARLERDRHDQRLRARPTPPWSAPSPSR